MLSAMVACGPPEEVPTADCTANLLPGELVITELMANPAGDDAGGEWFEVYNATAAILSLEGVVLTTSAADGSGESRHVIGDVLILPGEYLVFGNAQPDAPAGFIDHGYGDELELGDAGGRVAIECDVIVVDEVGYDSSKEGVSRALSSTVVPSAQDNDDATKWCEGISEYSIGNLGSPGRANDCSTEAGGDGRCDDGGQQRLLVPPKAGDLLITEVMADAGAVLDEAGEWFEVYVSQDVDLNGLTMGNDAVGGIDGVLESEACLRATAGSYLIFARNADQAANGGLPRVDHTFGFNLLNGEGGLFVGVGTTVLDAITWSNPVAGVSKSLDPDQFDTLNNDNINNWCPGTAAYGAGDLGTPGAGNPQCQIVTPGQCDDNGTMRPIVHPQPGEVAITEYMPNPDVVSDANGEWFEIRVDADVDLNELELGATQGTVGSKVESVECLRVRAGEYAIFARKADPAQNGGLPPVSGVFGFNLLQSGDGGVYVGVGGVELDWEPYSNSTRGVSTSFDEVAEIWCPTPVGPDNVYGPGDNRGTPARSNPSCQ